MDAEKKNRDYVLAQMKNAQLSNKKKVGMMWKDIIVPAYLLLYGYSNVLGKNWKNETDAKGKLISARAKMEKGYLLVPKEKKEKINDLLETYFTCFPKEVRVPKSEWEQYL